MFKKFLIFLLLLFLIVNVNAKEIDIHLFYQESCPHCAAEKVYLNELLKERDDIKVHLYNISTNANDQKLYKDIKKLLDHPSNGVPYTVIGTTVLIGYGEVSTKHDIEYLINKYKTEDYRDIVSEYKKDPKIKLDKPTLDERDEIVLPILGKINPKGVSILLIAVVIGLVDGFNPCAMWVLLFLISMLIGMKDKKKMLILGTIFIVTSALVYMLFMIAWLNVAIFATKIIFIRFLIGMFAIIFGVYNIIKFLTKPKDGCEIIKEDKRKDMITKIKKITTNKKFIFSIFGIMLLAATVNIIELLCSAGLPFTFTNILAMNNISDTKSFLYILVYIFFFMLDDLVIFLIAMFTLNVSGVSTKYSRYSSLVGGIIMLLIGLLMIFKPGILMFSI